jgi:multidrug efflux pump subunit AcrA (membrane-fusion protein)
MKKPILISIIVVVIAAAVGGYFLFGQKQASKYEFTNVTRGNVAQEVSVPGKVQPAQKVDLSF